MRKSRIVWCILLCTLFVTSCLERPYTPVVPIDEDFFDWKTVSTVDLDVKVDASGTIADNYARTVNVYSSPLFDDGSLMASGSSFPDKPFEYKLVLPTSLNKVYVEIIYPTGTVTQYVQDVSPETNAISVDTRVATKAAEPAAVPEIDVPEWGTVPSTFDVTINSNFHLLSLSGNNTYYVPAGADVSGPLSCANYTAGTHAVLYVAGKLTITRNADMVRSSIVVLDGGELVIDDDFKSYSYVTSEKPLCYVMEGGKIAIGTRYFSDVALEHQGTNVFVNKGELTVGGKFGGRINMCNGTPLLYNTGTIKYCDGKDLDFTLSNYSKIFNDGTIYASNVSLSNYCSITNYSNGTLDFEYYYQGNNTNSLTNYGFVDCTDMNIIGSVNNYGYIGVLDLDLRYLSEIICYYGSLIQGDEITPQYNSSIVIGSGSILSFNEISNYSGGCKISNEDDSYSLIIVNDNMTLGWGTYFSGDIEIWHKRLGTYGNRLDTDYYGHYGADVKWEKDYEDRSVNIPASDYNKGLGELTPPGPVDADGDGVMSDVDIDDNDPTIAYRSYSPNKDEYGTIMVEDLWPYTGDYDMNDVVCDYHIEWTSNAQNKVVYLEYYWKLRAVGSSKKIGMAVQLDSIPGSYVSSVTTTHNIEGDLPFYVVNGLEAGQAYPVIPLFNDPKELFGESTFINTVPDYQYYTVQTNSFKVVFAEPLEQKLVSLNRVNPFIVVTDFDNPTRDWEVHMPGFKRTSRASTVLNNQGGLSQSDPYLSNTGMMWMIRVPESIGYTIETINIESAYTHYKDWYKSKGESYKDWYLGPIDQTKLYSHTGD